jgi:hypothetical protein
MWHPYGDLTRKRLAFDRDCAVNAVLDIEWGDHPWNSRASSSCRMTKIPMKEARIMRPNAAR